MRQTATQFQMPGMVSVLNISPCRSLDTEPWAAFYCRLSQDDGLDGESNSIQHQKQILIRYAKEHGIKKYKFYVDGSSIIGPSQKAFQCERFLVWS